VFAYLESRHIYFIQQSAAVMASTSGVHLSGDVERFLDDTMYDSEDSLFDSDDNSIVN
jgi:hypothetical protein